MNDGQTQAAQQQVMHLDMLPKLKLWLVRQPSITLVLVVDSYQGDIQCALSSAQNTIQRNKFKRKILHTTTRALGSTNNVTLSTRIITMTGRGSRESRGVEIYGHTRTTLPANTSLIM